MSPSAIQKKIEELSVATTSGYMTVKEAAHYLRIEPTVMRNYLGEGKFTVYKFKTLTLVDVDEVEEWRKTHSRK